MALRCAANTTGPGQTTGHGAVCMRTAASFCAAAKVWMDSASAAFHPVRLRLRQTPPAA